MKKRCLLSVVIAGIFLCANTFARDDNHLQDITNWKQFFSKNGKTYSYEHEEGKPLVPVMYKFDNAVGYQYLYIKVNLPKEGYDELKKVFEEDHPEEFKNVEIGYTIGWYQVDCKSETIKLIQTYFYSDTNEYIISFNMKTDPGVKLAGSKFEKISLNKERMQISKQEAEFKEWLETLQRKYGVEKVVEVEMLEVNPYEFEGHTIAVVVQFQRMLSKSSAIFFSGYTNLSDSTEVPDQIIVTGIPEGTHFKSGFMAPRMLLALKGKGVRECTNAFGAIVNVPYFQLVTIISGKQKSVFEEQRDINRQNALQNSRNMR